MEFLKNFFKDDQKIIGLSYFKRQKSPEFKPYREQEKIYIPNIDKNIFLNI